LKWGGQQIADLLFFNHQGTLAHGY